MNYWLTTHWPPRISAPHSESNGVYLPHGREQAGRDLRAGDYVLIYQSRTGRTVIYMDDTGRRCKVETSRGRQGIIAIEQIISSIKEDPDAEPSEYADGTEIWWRWYADTKIITNNGFVPLGQVNRILGYSENYNMRGFGDFKSGLKKLTESQYLEFVELFKKKGKKVPLVGNTVTAFRRGSARRGEASESDSHRRLKEYIAEDPSRALGEKWLRTVAVEFEFCTADRADLVLEDHAGRIIGLEVEVSAAREQIEGVLQAIKYRFMLAPVKERLFSESRAFLVAYSLSQEIKEICRVYEVEYFEVSYSDVESWSKKRAIKRLKPGSSYWTNALTAK